MMKYRQGLCVLMALLCLGAEDADQSAREQIHERQRTEIESFLLRDSGQAQVPQTPMAIELYNEAVGYYKKREFEMAKMALTEAMSYDPRNPLIPQLLGEIYYAEYDLKKAKDYFTKSYLLRPDPEVRDRIEKINREAPLETNLKTKTTEKFILKYQGEAELAGEAIQEKLEKIYTVLSGDFGHAFRQPVVVVLYDREAFSKIMEVPHWIGGFYDGKVRIPAYQTGMAEKDLNRIMIHEMTHAFVAEMAARRAPAWINEGLAEYQEEQFGEQDRIVLQAALKTGSLLPLDQLMLESKLASEQDPLYAGLFYDQSYSLVRYIVKQKGMFTVKEMLQAFAKGKNSDEVIQEILKIPVNQLEQEWKQSLSEPSPSPK